MYRLFRCACCDGPLEPAQQLRFLVETDNLDNPALLARIRMMPSIKGKPVPVCSACQSQIEAAAHAKPLAASVAKPRAASPVRVKAPISMAVGFLGVLSVGLLLGSLLNSRG